MTADRVTSGAVPSATDAEPIAIVGVGCRFPGAASAREFWGLLLEGRHAISEIPADRFDAAALFDPTPAQPGRIMSRWGGFLDRIDRFDPGFFGISPREAERLDPQQRFLLETGWHALEDAGQVLSRDPGLAARTGVFVGLWLNDYEARLFREPDAIDFYMTLGSGRYSASGRLSYAFGLAGPSLTLDTACSSSLVAVHLACQSLRSGECAMALAGGANAILEPAITIAYSQSKMMAPDGRCKFGDARADGYVRSDGAGMVVLKRLSQAARDGDRIYALIMGSAVNNDGSSGFLATPSQSGQEQMLRRAYADARVSPGTVSYVEAHGTGTRAGDPVELGALGAVLAEGRARGTTCRVGSVKTNIGHTEGAAGIAGLIKVALSLFHRTLPASLHVETPNPDVPWADLPIALQRECGPWPAGPGPLTAGVSAFGIAGTNAHVVLRDVGSVDEEDEAPVTRVLALSSHTPDTLEALIDDYIAAADARTLPSIGALCHTAAVRRVHHPHRCAVLVDVVGTVGARLRDAKAATMSAGVARGVADADRRPVVFVCPGQGSQWIGMGRDLRAREPVFRDAIARCDAAMRRWTNWSLIEALEAPAERSRLAEIDVAQPVLCAYEMALAALWQSWGVKPDAVVGHSMGEVAAAHVAGALSIEDAMQVICRRSTLLRRVSGRGAMAVVELSVEDAQAAIRGYEDHVAVAVSNSRRSTVLSGAPAPLDAIIKDLERREVFCRLVKVDVASHSPQMDPLRDELRAALDGVAPRDSAIPIYSTVTAGVVTGTSLDAAYWTRNLREPVLFGRTIEALMSDGFVTFIEMSPHPLLVGAVEEAARQGDATRILSVGSARRDEPERDNLLDALARLYVRGHDIEWAAVSGAMHRVVSLPPYRWQRERFWFDAPPVAAPSKEGLRIPGPAMVSAAHPGTTSWEFDLSLARCPELADHRVRGRSVLPAAFSLLVMRDAAATALDIPAPRLEDLRFERVVDLEDGRTLRIQVAARRAADRTARIEVFSADADTAGERIWTRHASCRASVSAGQELDDIDETQPAVVGSALTSTDLNRRFAAHGLDYGARFSRLHEVRLTAGLASAALPAIGEGSRDGVRVMTPVVDAALQLVLAGVLRHGGDLMLPTEIASVEIDPGFDAGATGLTAAATFRPDALEGDTRVIDATRRTVLRARGVQFARVVTAAQGGADLRELSWAPSPLPATSTTCQGRWLVLADRGGLGDSVAAALTQRGGQVIVARAGQSFVQTDLAISIRPDVPGDYDRLFEAAAAPDGPLRGIVHLWSLDLAVPDDDGDADWSRVHECGALGAVRLAHACVTANAAPECGLLFVTASAQRVVPDDVDLRFPQAAIWGAASVIAAEHPELRSTCLDVDKGAPATTSTAILDELIGKSQDLRVAVRSGVRYVAALGPVREARAVTPARAAETRSPRPFRVRTDAPGRIDGMGPHPLVRRRPGAGEVEIAVEATGVNFMNVMSAMGICPGYPDGVGPLGIECSGTVSAVGTGVSGWHPGDPVMAVAFDCLGSHAIADAHLVVPRAPALAPTIAAGIPIVFLTAHYALAHLARLVAGERVLIHSAASGVGQAALQIARRAGAEIFATAGSDDKREWLRSQGVTHVFDSRSHAFAGQVRRVTGRDGVDVVLNSLSGEAISLGLDLLRSGGRFVEIGKRDIYDDRQIGLAPFRRNLSYFAVDLDRMAREQPARVGGMLREVVAMVGAGELAPLPTRVFPIDRVGDAFRDMAQGRHSGKLVVDVRAGTMPPPRDAVEAAAGGTVLITGGFGAIGLTMADWLVERGVDCIVLLGRHPDAPAARAAVTRLERRGVTVMALACDVANRAALGDALGRVRRDLPPLTGIVHAAGVLDDATLAGQSLERWQHAFDAKARGASHLDALTAGDPLAFFIMTSSVASFLGLAGQANYAAANAWLDALAEARRAAGRPALSLGWGPWSGIGLAATDARGGRLAAKGLHSLTPEQARQAFDRAIVLDAAHVAVAALDTTAWIASAADGAPLLRGLAAGGGTAVTVTAKTAEAVDLRTALLAVPAGPSRRRVMDVRIKEELGRVLRLAPERIDGSKAFRALGLDSLMGLELRHRLEQATGTTLRATAIWNYPTVAQLGAHLAECLGVDLARVDTAHDAGPAVAPSNDVASADDLDRLLDELEQLSDEDAARLAGGDQ